MTDHKTAVAFGFSRVRKQPSKSELAAEPRFKFQMLVIRQWASATGHKLEKTFWHITTYREADFTKTAEFRQAVGLATKLKAHVVLANIWDLLSRTAPDRITDRMSVLDAIQVEIWDAGRNRRWSSLSLVDRRDLKMQALGGRSGRSRPISRKRKLRTADSSVTTAGRLGNAASKKRADAAASRHADFVRGEIAKLPPGVAMSPSALAKALNDAGIPATRSDNWTHNSAKNLLRRLRKLGEI